MLRAILCFGWIGGADVSYRSDEEKRQPRVIILRHIKGKAAGSASGQGGRPRITGTLNQDGLIRFDCENYPEHWLEIRLPDRLVDIWAMHG